MKASYCEAQNQTQHARCGLTNVKQGGCVTSLTPVASLLTQPRTGLVSLPRGPIAGVSMQHPPALPGSCVKGPSTGCAIATLAVANRTWLPPGITELMRIFLSSE